MSESNKRLKTPPAYAEAMKINKDPQRRLLSRPAVTNKLAVKVEYPVTKVSTGKKNKKSIDVNSNHFLPKLPDANTGNSKSKIYNMLHRVASHRLTPNPVSVASLDISHPIST